MMRDRIFLEAEIFGHWESQRLPRAFKSLQRPPGIDFSEAMTDPDLVMVADGMHQMMGELDISTADEFAAAFGHDVRESSSMKLLGITSQSGESPNPITLQEGLKPRVREFVLYHELGHQVLFSTGYGGLWREVSTRQEEVFCDAFACLMIGNKMPPRPLRPMSL